MGSQKSNVAWLNIARQPNAIFFGNIFLFNFQHLIIGGPWRGCVKNWGLILPALLNQRFFCMTYFFLGAKLSLQIAFPGRPPVHLIKTSPQGFASGLKLTGSGSGSILSGQTGSGSRQKDRIRIQTPLSWKFSIYFVIFLNEKLLPFHFLTVL